MGKVCTGFQNRKNRRKNHTRWGGKYLYGLYKGVPPPRGASKEEQDKPTRQQVISETLIWRNHIYDVVILRPTFVAPFSDRDHLGFKSIYLATLRLPFIDRELTNRRLSHDATAGSCHSSALPSCRNLNLRFVVKTTTLVRAAGKFSRRFWSLFSSFHK